MNATSVAIASHAPETQGPESGSVLAGGAARKSDRTVDPSSIPWNIPQALLNEFQAAAITGMSVKWLRRQRCLGTGPRFRKLSGATVRYRLADLLAWVEAQPAGGVSLPNEGERRGPGRPRKANA